MAETNQDQSQLSEAIPAPAPETPSAPAVDGLQWTASEFVAHEKSTAWYVQLYLAAVLLAALIYFVTRDVISTAVVTIIIVIFGKYAGRQPRELQYRIDDHGITIGPKTYSFQKFRSFSVSQEGAFTSINFLPLKRFALPISIYLAPDLEEAAVKTLSGILPIIEHRPDAVDRLMSRIRF